ncbi:MAG: hypothetical protein EXS13_12080 [Planctomycetes bacterium]|nr:hypothetical protein [Planctomycetota bacterium]
MNSDQSDSTGDAGGLLLATIPTVFTPPLGGTGRVAGAGILDFQVLVADPAAVQRMALSNGAELVIGG